VFFFFRKQSPLIARICLSILKQVVHTYSYYLTFKGLSQWLRNQTHSTLSVGYKVPGYSISAVMIYKPRSCYLWAVGSADPQTPWHVANADTGDGWLPSADLHTGWIHLGSTRLLPHLGWEAITSARLRVGTRLRNSTSKELSTREYFKGQGWLTFSLNFKSKLFISSQK
jgi:hypothetical protein